MRQRGVNRRRRRHEHGTDSVTGVLEQPAIVCLDRIPHLRIVGRERQRIAPASASHRLVDPSMSVNKNVTMPDGAEAFIATSPRAPGGHAQLVDLRKCELGHVGVRHGHAGPAKCFVGLIAEHFAQIREGGVDFGV